jgi:hypothetical protein
MSRQAVSAIRAWQHADNKHTEVKASIREEARSAAEAAEQAVRSRRADEEHGFSLARDNAMKVMLDEVCAVARSLAGQHVLTFVHPEREVRHIAVPVGTVREDENTYQVMCSCGYDGVRDPNRPWGSARWTDLHKGQVIAFCDDEFEEHVIMAVADALGLEGPAPIYRFRSSITRAMTDAENEGDDDNDQEN